MDRNAGLVTRFEADRPHLRSVAFRMLGSLDDADEAVQQTWIKASEADLSEVRNLSGWLTTVVGRECLDQLRARKRRDEVALPDDHVLAAADSTSGAVDEEALLAESVGRALLVVLDRLSPTERVALVLHDMFAVPSDEVAPIVGRSAIAAKKMASRARQKVHRDVHDRPAQTVQQHQLAAAFLAAARGGHVTGLLAVLAPDVVRRADAAALPAGVPREIRGADAVVEETIFLRARAASAELALVDDEVGVIVATRGRLQVVLVLTFADNRIAAYDVIASPARLDELTITLLDYSSGAGVT
jgi:RNA polymerase sigma-70 factor (ECF subfamily)